MLTNVQQELLKVFAYDLSQEDLLALRWELARFFGERAIAQADETWDKAEWDEEKVENLLNKKLRKRR